MDESAEQVAALDVARSLTEFDTIAGQSADLLSDMLGFVLLRGCTVRLVRTDLAAATATTLERWNSPTQC